MNVQGGAKSGTRTFCVKYLYIRGFTRKVEPYNFRNMDELIIKHQTTENAESHEAFAMNSLPLNRRLWTDFKRN